MMNAINTRTGTIYYDEDRQLEFLSVGDYGKENNLKADFLGLKKRIDGVKHRHVDKAEKWVVTISTQKGCWMCCNFCDVWKYGFYGNMMISELAYQVEYALRQEDLTHTKRLNLHFARMGEPTFNTNVLSFTRDHLRPLVNRYIETDDIHPVVSTMMPANHDGLGSYLLEWCDIKNSLFNGNAGLQLSINTTNNKKRYEAFRGASCSLRKISLIAEMLPMPVGRKYTLNFAVTEDTVLEADELDSLFDKDKFIVKITPIHKTSAAIESDYNLSTTYEKYDVYERFEQPLVEAGWDVIVFVPSKEEDEDRITCGNALLANRFIERGHRSNRR